MFQIWDLLYFISKSLCSSALLGSSTVKFGGWIVAVIIAYVSECNLRSAGCFLSAPRTPVGPAEQRSGQLSGLAYWTWSPAPCWEGWEE